MTHYIINALASQDLTEIADYFFMVNIEAGEKFFREFNRKCQQIVNFPYSGKSYAYIYPELRGLLLENYVIFYRILEDSIEILRVVNARRNLPDIFK